MTKNNYYIFDPHSRDRNVKVVESSASILLHFTTIRQFCSYIQELCSSLNCNYYEITTASVNSLLFERYVTDQNRRQAEKNETKVNQETSTSKLTKREREALKHEQNYLRMVKNHQEFPSVTREKLKMLNQSKKKEVIPKLENMKLESRDRTGVTLKSVKKTENI